MPFSACSAPQPKATEADVRSLLTAKSGVVHLPPGTIEITSELQIGKDAAGLEIHGHPSGTTLRAADGFKGRAIFLVEDASKVAFRDFTIDGNRGKLEKRLPMPPSEVPFYKFYPDNGIVAEGVKGIDIERVKFRNVVNFPILISHSSAVLVRGVEIADSGSRNQLGRNNTSGGILIEEGTEGFEVRDSVFRNVRGNAVWTHSLYTSARSRDGLISGNRFEGIGRDAIQVGHATRVRVEKNTGTRIGYPVEEVDVENEGTPVAIDTAGDVDHSVYAENRFEEINGKCLDLDGFHDGEIRGNVCINRRPPEEYAFGHFGIVLNDANIDMRSKNIVISGNTIDGAKFGGIFVIGTNHRIVDNRFLNLNTAGCNENHAKFGCLYNPKEPDLLQTGIYLANGTWRVSTARDNIIQGNTITGHKMSQRCIAAAPGVSLKENRIENNTCKDTEKPKRATEHQPSKWGGPPGPRGSPPAAAIANSTFRRLSGEAGSEGIRREAAHQLTFAFCLLRFAFCLFPRSVTSARGAQ